MDKVDVIILMWFCFVLGALIPDWVLLTQELIKNWRSKNK